MCGLQLATAIQSRLRWNGGELQTCFFFSFNSVPPQCCGSPLVLHSCKTPGKTDRSIIAAVADRSSDLKRIYRVGVGVRLYGEAIGDSI